MKRASHLSRSCPPNPDDPGNCRPPHQRSSGTDPCQNEHPNCLLLPRDKFVRDLAPMTPEERDWIEANRNLFSYTIKKYRPNIFRMFNHPHDLDVYLLPFVLHYMRLWDPEKGTKLSTFVCVGLSRFGPRKYDLVRDGTLMGRLPYFPQGKDNLPRLCVLMGHNIPVIEDEPEEDRIDPALIERLPEALQSLTPRQQQVIRRRFGLEPGTRTLTGMGHELGITTERVRQLEISAIRRLRKYFKVDQDQPEWMFPSGKYKFKWKKHQNWSKSFRGSRSLYAKLTSSS